MSEPTSAIAPAKVWHIPLLESDKTDALTSGLKARVETTFDTIQITVALEDYRTLCERLLKAGFDFPSSLSGTDFEWGLGVALHLQQLESKRKVTVRTYCTYEKPHVPTVSDLWGGVDWHEREAYDLVGIVFEGHHDSVNGHPRRILLEDHWTIHPLQKRYNTRGYLIHGWSAKPFPSPAPWEEGFQPFSGAPVPVAHVAPPAPKAVAAPVLGVVEHRAPDPAQVPTTAAPMAEVVSSDPPKKVAKKWVPKTDVAPSPAPEVSSSQPVLEASSSQPAPEPVKLEVAAVAEAPVAEAPAPEPQPEEKPRNPKIKRWEPKS